MATKLQVREGLNTELRMAQPASLPVRDDLRLAYGFSLLIALLVAISSLAGLLDQTQFYPASQLVDPVGSDCLLMFLVIGILPCALPILFTRAVKE